MLLLEEAQWGPFLASEAGKLAVMASLAPIRVQGAGPLADRVAESQYQVPVATDGQNVKQWREANTARSRQ